MKKFQERFLFYVRRLKKIMTDPGTAQAKVQPYDADDFNTLSGALFEMCFTNYLATTEEGQSLELPEDILHAYEIKRIIFASALTDVVAKAIYQKVY